MGLLEVRELMRRANESDCFSCFVQVLRTVTWPSGRSLSLVDLHKKQETIMPPRAQSVQTDPWPAAPPPPPSTASMTDDHVVRALNAAKVGDIMFAYWRREEQVAEANDEFVDVTAEPNWILWTGKVTKAMDPTNPTALQVTYYQKQPFGAKGTFWFPPEEDENPGTIFGLIRFVRSQVVEKPLKMRRIEGTTEDDLERLSQHQAGWQSLQLQQIPEVGSGHPRVRQTFGSAAGPSTGDFIRALVDHKQPEETIVLVKGLRIPATVKAPYNALYFNYYLADSEYKRWDADWDKLLLHCGGVFRSNELLQQYMTERDTYMQMAVSLTELEGEPTKDDLHLVFLRAASTIASIVKSRDGGGMAEKVIPLFNAQWKKGLVDLKELLVDPAQLKDKTTDVDKTTEEKPPKPATTETAASAKLNALETRIGDISSAVTQLTTLFRQQHQQANAHEQYPASFQPHSDRGRGRGRGRGSGRGRGW